MQFFLHSRLNCLKYEHFYVQTQQNNFFQKSLRGPCEGKVIHCYVEKGLDHRYLWLGCWKFWYLVTKQKCIFHRKINVHLQPVTVIPRYRSRNFLAPLRNFTKTWTSNSSRHSLEDPGLNPARGYNMDRPESETTCCLIWLTIFMTCSVTYIFSTASGLKYDLVCEFISNCILSYMSINTANTDQDLPNNKQHLAEF